MLARLADRVDEPISEVPVDELRHEFEVEAGALSPRAHRSVAVEDGSAGGVPSRLYVPAGGAGAGPAARLLPRRGLGPGLARDPRRRAAGYSPTSPACASSRWTTAWRPSTPSRRARTMRWRRTCTRPRTPATSAPIPPRLALGGDSAGGNLAAVTAQTVRNRGLRPPAFQLLIYPVTDIAAKTESYRAFSRGFSLTERNMDWYADQYVPDPSRRADPRVSPLRAESLSGLPPAYVATALADPLRDEGEAYARRLAEDGVRVALQRHPAPARVRERRRHEVGTPGHGPHGRRAPPGPGVGMVRCSPDHRSGCAPP